MLVKDVMNKKIIYCYENDNLLSVIKKLLKYNISGMPVVDKNKRLKGIISITDIINFLERKVAKTEIKKSLWEFSLFIFEHFFEKYFLEKVKVNLLKEKAKNIMRRDVITIEENKTVGEAIEKMKKHDISRLIVVKNSKVVGIITKTDILRHLLK